MITLSGCHRSAAFVATLQREIELIQGVDQNSPKNGNVYQFRESGAARGQVLASPAEAPVPAGRDIVPADRDTIDRGWCKSVGSNNEERIHKTLGFNAQKKEGLA